MGETLCHQFQRHAAANEIIEVNLSALWKKMASAAGEAGNSLLIKNLTDTRQSVIVMEENRDAEKDP